MEPEAFAEHVLEDNGTCELMHSSSGEDQAEECADVRGVRDGM